MPYTTAQRTTWAKHAARTSQLDAAHKFGVSTTAIRNAMRAFGVAGRKPGAPGSYTVAQTRRAVRMVNRGKPAEEIERKTGIGGKYARKLWRQVFENTSKPSPERTTAAPGCEFDTDQDGDCHLCARQGGCPMMKKGEPSQ